MKRASVQLAGAALALLSSAAAAAPAGNAPSAPSFVGAAQLVEVEPGRRLNLRCIGSGPQTVLFDSGGSDWSSIWALIQPDVARHATACSYDRAGLGYSGPSELPRTPAAIVEDLHSLVETAKLKRPLVLVGHSLGGFNMKLYAALYPADVAGLVLVDPAEERAWDRTRADLQVRFGKTAAARAELLDQTWRLRLLAHFRQCAGSVPAAGYQPGSAELRRCTDPPRPMLGPEIEADRNRILPTKAFQDAQSSEILNSVYGNGANDTLYPLLFRPGVFGERPMIVLSHGRYDAADPLDVLDHAQMTMLHRQSARLARWGKQKTVPDTGHNIQLTKPQAVIDAILSVLRDLR